MTATITDNGNLKFKLDEGDEMEEGSEREFSELLEYYSCNGGFDFVPPENIGALTDSPILADSIDIADEPRSLILPSPGANVYWYPNYAIRCPFETLKTDGEVIFLRGS